MTVSKTYVADTCQTERNCPAWCVRAGFKKRNGREDGAANQRNQPDGMGTTWRDASTRLTVRADGTAARWPGQPEPGFRSWSLVLLSFPRVSSGNPRCPKDLDARFRGHDLRFTVTAFSPHLARGSGHSLVIAPFNCGIRAESSSAPKDCRDSDPSDRRQATPVGLWAGS